MGDIYPPGSYILVRCPEGIEPSELQGEKIAGNHAGRFSASGDLSLSHSVPPTHGVYLLVRPSQQ